MARKILLADDSVTAQNMGRKILADAGYDVITVNNGSAALKRIAEAAPDLIILDVYMPGYSGLEVCQRLKEAAETADIPVLLSVGKLEPFKPQEARRVRADAHIVKPFEASQLLTAIARLEDAMVPQQHKSSHRFATSSADEPFAKEESRILGRGAKLSKKKEASPAESTDSRLSSQAATFRDFRKKAKSAASSSADEFSEAATAESAQKPAPLPDLPRDITPEELSALSEVAAKLNEAAPEAYVSETAEPVDLPTPAPDPVEISAVAKNEIEIPVAQVEPPSETTIAEATVQVEPAHAESRPGEYPQNAEVPFPEPVSVASFPEEPAAVDQQDEPMFASARAEETLETPPSEAPISSADLPRTEESAVPAEAEEIMKKEEFAAIDSSFAQPAFAESASSESNAAEFCAVEGPISEATRTDDAFAIAPATEAAIEPEAPMPSDAELAEALRLLTPATVPAEPVTPVAETVSATASWSDRQTMEVSAGKRWVAEALELTPEETAMSLEAEMFRAFAANAEKIESIPVEDPLQAIQTAVEKRIAEEVAASEPASEVAAKAMAAAAPLGHSSATPDETEIASIVDKVMADLRPKIVAEIARKLAGK